MMDKSIFVYTIDNENNYLLVENYLRRIIAYHNIDFTCFEAGYFDYRNRINFNNLKISNNKLILVLHEFISDNHYIHSFSLKSFSAVFSVRTKNLHTLSHPNKHVFNNGVLEAENHYQFNKSNKIFIAARLDIENLMFAKKLVLFAKLNSLEVDFAGKAVFSNEQQFIQEILKLNNKVNFIGYVDVLSYLKQNNNKYLFIVGVLRKLLWKVCRLVFLVYVYSITICPLLLRITF